MKILLISNMYPSVKDKTYGTFVKCFQEGLVQYDKSIKFEEVISVPLKSGQININQTIPEKGKN